MKNGAYLAINYACNEFCRFCPCSVQEKKEKRRISLHEVDGIIRQLFVEKCREVTISGGEPTLHPDFVEILFRFQKAGMNVTVLTNGELLSDVSLQERMKEKLNLSGIRIITTLHSHSPSEHEKANRIEGSFCRSVNGLKFIQNMGAKVEIKHCITKENYQELASFYSFCDLEFDESAALQMCSIDYCGMKKEEREQEMLAFYDIKPFLEEMFDLHLRRLTEGSQRRLYCINMPLCSCDVYYWKFMPKRSGKIYDNYFDPYMDKISEAGVNSGVDIQICRDCQALEFCCGTYRTAFDSFGERIIRPYRSGRMI